MTSTSENPPFSLECAGQGESGDGALLLTPGVPPAERCTLYVFASNYASSLYHHPERMEIIQPRVAHARRSGAKVGMRYPGIANKPSLP